MARTQYTATFPNAHSGDRVTWPNTVTVYGDASRQTPLPVAYLNESKSVTFFSDATSVAVTVNGETLTLTTGAPTKTGAASSAGFVSKAQADAAYRPFQEGGNGTVFLGDSITLGSDGATNHGASWPTFAALLSGQRLFYLANVGITGNVSADLLARFDTDVTPSAPRIVTISIGANDIAGSVTLATFQANIAALVAKVRSIGARPILTTIPPNNVSGRHATITLWNAWLKRYAWSERLDILDFYQVLVDPANGNYLAAYNSGDGTHPSAAGYYALGSYVATWAATALPLWSPILPMDAGDPNNKVSNGLMLTDATANNEPEPWFIINAGSGTPSYVTDTAIQGRWWKGAVAANASIYGLAQNGIAVVVGHRYAIGGRILTSLSAGSVDLQWVFAGGATTARPFATMSPSVASSVFYQEFVAPAGSTSQQVQLQIAAGSTGYAQLAQVGIYDLTALGLSA